MRPNTMLSGIFKTKRSSPVNTTVREANDRGFDCLVPEDCVGSYFPEFQAMGLKMIAAQGGIFGWVSHSSKILAALEGTA